MLSISILYDRAVNRVCIFRHVLCSAIYTTKRKGIFLLLFFRRLQLQVLLISTVEKSTAIQPYCDITYSIVRHGDANAIAPFVRLAAEHEET